MHDPQRRLQKNRCFGKGHYATTSHQLINELAVWQDILGLCTNFGTHGDLIAGDYSRVISFHVMSAAHAIQSKPLSIKHVWLASGVVLPAMKVGQSARVSSQG